MMRKPDIDQNWTIFSSLYQAARERELKRLRLAKCGDCGRATPYRLRSLEITAIRCRRCGTSLPIRVRKRDSK